ncbi:malonyl CoA-ACP transacylase [Neoasaia chiangmaiensis NBRC 101099]|uniref:Malonyl CoA-acyl carrier protein transacylase n=1 Tax=Neoasaia chiangmaiensis TaxID=320497 RepID=A0A1U9KSM1_9PROT|nr:ACP S-malonyltransferase [Neoasaia chiangmaiensis]AQS88808.1 malonyl CoA-acyl carrier protein transacylase [Neoasaia chiangmaiensis]GBR40723.1 malonyl CoA-ACP transacylase [Neoasaia chiangmaiensis NBRC 101099]GEN13771.1 malonyl CoA-acyl carrier protein transacylase [Neoasaia chiangmaiensis]
MSVHAFVFPGQGSQSVGMGLSLFEAFGTAREVFQEVDDALNQKLSELIFRGEPDELTRTENAQPALMAVSMATLRVLESEGGLKLPDVAALVAGHSLGEYSALAAAGSFGIAQTARLLRLRGQAMQRAVPAGEGGMAALLGVDLDQARAICETAAVLKVNGQPDRQEVLEVANDNGGGQVVVSGQLDAVKRAIEEARSRGVKRAVLLPVSAPFHCSLMRPAADEMAEALARADIAAPVVPVVANVTAAKATDPAMIRDLLVRQVTGSVRWRESVQAMAAMGVDSIVELGAGKVLSGLVRRIDGDLAVKNAGTPDEIEALLKTL